MLEEEKIELLYFFQNYAPHVVSVEKQIIFVNEVSFNESFSSKKIKEGDNM